MDNRNSPDRDIPPVDLDIPTTDIPSRSSDLIDYLGQGESVGAELVGVHIDLILTDETTDTCDFRHTGDCTELKPDKPILKGAKLAQVESIARLGRDRVIEIVFVDPTDTGRIRS